MYKSLNLAPTVDVNTTETPRLPDLIRYHNAGQVVFCSKNIPAQEIITLMASLKTTGIEYKIAPSESDYIIGSNGIDTDDDGVAVPIETIASPSSQRKKRLFDIATALLLTLATPVLIWFQHDPKHYVGHCLSVLIGRYTWVGYTNRKGIFAPSDIMDCPSPQLASRLNYKYMQKYSLSTDWAILVRNITKI